MSSHKPTVEAVPRHRKRLWWIAGGIAAGVCVATLSGWLVVRWWTAEPWDGLEQLAATFPVPEGFEPSEPVRIGDRPAVCEVKFSCQDPAIGVDYVQVSSGRADACDAVEASTEAWESAGFSIREPDPHVLEQPCVVNGEINGHFAQVFGFLDDDGVPSLRLLIGN